MSELPDEVWWYQHSDNSSNSVVMEPEGAIPLALEP